MSVNLAHCWSGITYLLHQAKSSSTRESTLEEANLGPARYLRLSSFWANALPQQTSNIIAEANATAKVFLKVLIFISNGFNRDNTVKTEQI